MSGERTRQNRAMRGVSRCKSQVKRKFDEAGTAHHLSSFLVDKRDGG